MSGVVELPKKREDSDAKLAAELRTAVHSLCAKMQEADRRGVDLNFNIGRGSDGMFVVAFCNVSKRI